VSPTGVAISNGDCDCYKTNPNIHSIYPILKLSHIYSHNRTKDQIYLTKLQNKTIKRHNKQRKYIYCRPIMNASIYLLFHNK